jgi:tetratricopeptide (TPR) repeat protein
VRSLFLAALLGPPPQSAPAPPEPLESVLGDNPGTWDPDEGPTTPWARAGSRSARDCRSRSDVALRDLPQLRDVLATVGELRQWTERAQHCPNAPEVLRRAAFAEVSHEVALPVFGGEEVDLAAVDGSAKRSRTRALEWLDAADRESARRGEPSGIGTHYYRARALLALGRPAAARAAAQRELAEGRIGPWRVYRVLALAAMMEGDLEAALRWSRRAVVQGPDAARVLSEQVYALVLDRAGDFAGARQIIQRWRHQDPSEAPSVLSSMLPTHERLFHRALHLQLSGAHLEAPRLWKAYLEREEPSRAERELAERHLAELAPPAPEA